MTAAAGTMPASAPRTTDERIIRVRASGFGRRLLAGLIDMTVLGSVTMGVTVGLAIVLHLDLPATRQLGPDLLVAGVLDRNPMAVGGVGLFLGLYTLYQLYFGGIAGQTFGMRALGIRVISGQGTAPGPARGMARLAALLVGLIPGGMGFLWAVFDREHRAFHDHLAGTYVILDR